MMRLLFWRDFVLVIQLIGGIFAFSNYLIIYLFLSVKLNLFDKSILIDILLSIFRSVTGIILHFCIVQIDQNIVLQQVCLQYDRYASVIKNITYNYRNNTCLIDVIDIRDTEQLLDMSVYVGYYDYAKIMFDVVERLYNGQDLPHGLTHYKQLMYKICEFLVSCNLKIKHITIDECIIENVEFCNLLKLQHVGQKKPNNENAPDIFANNGENVDRNMTVNDLSTTTDDSFLTIIDIDGLNWYGICADVRYKYFDWKNIIIFGSHDVIGGWYKNTILTGKFLPEDLLKVDLIYMKNIKDISPCFVIYRLACESIKKHEWIDKFLVVELNYRDVGRRMYHVRTKSDIKYCDALSFNFQIVKILPDTSSTYSQDMLLHTNIVKNGLDIALPVNHVVVRTPTVSNYDLEKEEGPLSSPLQLLSSPNKYIISVNNGRVDYMTGIVSCLYSVLFINVLFIMENVHHFSCENWRKCQIMLCFDKSTVYTFYSGLFDQIKNKINMTLRSQYNNPLLSMDMDIKTTDFLLLCQIIADIRPDNINGLCTGRATQEKTSFTINSIFRIKDYFSYQDIVGKIFSAISFQHKRLSYAYVITDIQKSFAHIAINNVTSVYGNTHANFYLGKNSSNVLMSIFHDWENNDTPLKLSCFIDLSQQIVSIPIALAIKSTNALMMFGNIYRCKSSGFVGCFDLSAENHQIGNVVFLIGDNLLLEMALNLPKHLQSLHKQLWHAHGEVKIHVVSNYRQIYGLAFINLLFGIKNIYSLRHNSWFRGNQISCQTKMTINASSNIDANYFMVNSVEALTMDHQRAVIYKQIFDDVVPFRKTMKSEHRAIVEAIFQKPDILAEIAIGERIVCCMPLLLNNDKIKYCLLLIPPRITFLYEDIEKEGLEAWTTSTHVQDIPNEASKSVATNASHELVLERVVDDHNQHLMSMQKLRDIFRIVEPMPRSFGPKVTKNMLSYCYSLGQLANIWKKSNMYGHANIVFDLNFLSRRISKKTFALHGMLGGDLLICGSPDNVLLYGVFMNITSISCYVENTGTQLINGMAKVWARGQHCVFSCSMQDDQLLGLCNFMGRVHPWPFVLIGDGYIKNMLCLNIEHMKCRCDGTIAYHVDQKNLIANAILTTNQCQYINESTDDQEIKINIIHRQRLSQSVKKRVANYPIYLRSLVKIEDLEIKDHILASHWHGTFILDWVNDHKIINGNLYLKEGHIMIGKTSVPILNGWINIRHSAFTVLMTAYRHYDTFDLTINVDTTKSNHAVMTSNPPMEMKDRLSRILFERNFDKLDAVSKVYVLLYADYLNGGKLNVFQKMINVWRGSWVSYTDEAIGIGALLTSRIYVGAEINYHQLIKNNVTNDVAISIIGRCDLSRRLKMYVKTLKIPKCRLQLSCSLL